MKVSSKLSCYYLLWKFSFHTLLLQHLFFLLCCFCPLFYYHIYQEPISPVVQRQNSSRYLGHSQSIVLFIDEEISKKDPLSWYEVNKIPGGGQSYRRYITKVIPPHPSMEQTKLIELKIGDETDCLNRIGDDVYCNGPLEAGLRYRLVKLFLLHTKE